YDERSIPQAPAQEGPEGTAGLADCDDCILWSEPQPSDEGHCWHRAIRECRGERVARLEGGSRRHPYRPPYRPGDIGIYRAASRVIGRNTDAIDHKGEWCPAGEFWHGRDRFMGQTIRFSLLVPMR